MAIYYETINVSKKMSAIIKKYLNATLRKDFQGEDDTIIYTAVFPDGKFVDIKCCGSNDESSWTEGVLFDKYGCEISTTEVCDDFLGKWTLSYEDDEYNINVIEEEK